jgi:hypothetical protein
MYRLKVTVSKVGPNYFQDSPNPLRTSSTSMTRSASLSAKPASMF